ncbi:MAG: hypothetical protein JST92_16600, partial [Deltaproteobacteria bacterium]|nr:hypothetical protein [Deltaproteobacteria bacterium]
MRSSWVLSGGVVAALVLLGQTITLPGNGTFSAGNNDLNTTPGAASVIRRKTAGGLSAFVGTGATLPGGRTNAAVAGYNRALFAIGGSVTNSGTLTSLTDVYINIARSDGTLPGWTPVTQLPDARYGANATAYNGFLYLAGGATSAGKAATDILMAPIDPAGTSLGAWIVAGTLPQYGYVPYATNNLLYMVGWETSGNPDVYSAPISSDGTLGTFTQRTAFPTKVLSPGIAITPQALYVIGGQTPGGNTSVRTTQIGFILANGALQWVNGPQLPTARTADWVVIDGGYLYLLGQEPGETTSYAAPVLANGMLGPWISVPNAPGTACYGNAWNLGGTIYTATIGGNTCKGTTSLTAGTVGGLDTFGIGLPLGSARGGAAMASMLDTVALVGGQAASGTLSDVQWGTVSSLGVFGGFSAGPNGLPGPRSAHAAVAQHGSLYVIGGLDNNGNPLGDVLKSSFKGGSAPGAFSQQASALPSARSGVAALATDTHLYVLGGLTQTGLVNDIQVASISQGSGDLGSFAASAHTFTTARSGLAALTYNGRLYVIGGDDGTDKLGDIQYADLDPQTGALGTFSTATHALDVPRSGHAAFARDGVLYVVGGATSSTELGDTQMATFGLDGDLSAFTSAGASFTVPRHGFGAASVGQYALFAGGFGASGPVTNVSVTQTLAPSAVGVYSRLFDLGGVPSGAFDLTLDGSAVNGVLRGASLQGTTLLDFGGPITPGQTISLTPNGRTLFLQLTLDDSQSAVISGGNERDVTGLTLTYTPQAGPTKLA